MTTPLQRKMIVAIAESDFTPVNGAVPETLEDIDWVWANDIIEDAIDKGVFTSLLNANLVDHGGKNRDAVVTLTTAGFAEYQRIKTEEKTA